MHQNNNPIEHIKDQSFFANKHNLSKDDQHFNKQKPVYNSCQKSVRHQHEVAADGSLVPLQLALASHDEAGGVRLVLALLALELKLLVAAVHEEVAIGKEAAANPQTDRLDYAHSQAAVLQSVHLTGVEPQDDNEFQHRHCAVGVERRIQNEVVLLIGDEMKELSGRKELHHLNDSHKN